MCQRPKKAPNGWKCGQSLPLATDQLLTTTPCLDPEPPKMPQLPPNTELSTSDLGSPATGNSCCSLGKWGAAALLVTTFASVGFAAYFAGRSGVATQAPVYFPPIDAAAAVSSEKFSMATGVVSNEAEGLFVLDHNSGLLQCTVMYPRMGGKFMASFTVNVADTLATGGKGGRYVMATGLADFPKNSNSPAAPSVVYVLDTATGNYACYGIPFNETLMNARRAQQGVLVLLSTGTANPVIDRDNFR